MGSYRPAIWTQPALVYLQVNVPAQANNLASLTDLSETPASTLIYVFDAVMRTSHSQQLQITSLPIQTGANIADHAFIKPATVELEIGMSDAMDQYASGGNSTAWPAIQGSKSVGTYQTLLTLQQNRTPMTLTTRLQTYKNVLIASIRVPDDYRTRYALKATVTFQQIFMASIVTEAASSRPDSTTDVNNGTVTTSGPPNTALLTSITPSDLNTSSTPNITGTQDVSSFACTAGPLGF